MWSVRCAWAAAAIGLAAIVSGAFITSTKVALEPNQGDPGVGVHRVIALAAIAMLCVALAASEPPRIALGIALAALLASAATGWNHPLSPGVAVWHAALAHLFSGSIATALLMATPSWSKPAEPIDAGEWKLLRPAAIAAPFAVFGQIVMGSLYRHQLTGILPHMLGAMVVALLTLVVSALVLQHFAERAELKRAAALLLSAVLLQICLGITTFVLVLLNVTGTSAFVWIATSHVTVGTLVFAATILMAIEVSRNLAPTGSAG